MRLSTPCFSSLNSSYGPWSRGQKSTLLDGNRRAKDIGYEDGMLLADIAAYHRWKHLCGHETLRWRSGIKHDCAKVMELCAKATNIATARQMVDIEDVYVYPMLKSSHLAQGGEKTGSRFMLVTQRTVGEQTTRIEEEAPKTWAYLISHADLFRNARVRFIATVLLSLCLASATIASPLGKLRLVGSTRDWRSCRSVPIDGKPVVFDDTSYFLPCSTRQQAVFLATLLNSPVARSFFGAFVFWDTKRPDHCRVIAAVGPDAACGRAWGRTRVRIAFWHRQERRENTSAARSRERSGAQLDLWPR